MHHNISIRNDIIKLIKFSFLEISRIRKILALYGWKELMNETHILWLETYRRNLRLEKKTLKP